MFKFIILKLYIFLLILSSVCFAESFTILAGVASREVHSDTGEIYRNTSGTWDVVTQQAQYPDTGGRCVVLAFRLPVLPEGKMIGEASFSIYYVGRSPERVGPNDSLYAINYRSTSTITLNDYFEGAFWADTSAEPIESNLVDFDNEGAWNTTRQGGSQRLVRFLRNQYKDGAVGNEWFFLRINSEQAYFNNYSLHKYASINYQGGTNWNPSEYTPFIEYTLVDADQLDARETIEAGAAAELKPNLAPVFFHTPIQHQKYFLHERERLGYNPRYMVNSPQFDSNNTPYMREKYAVRTLGEDGKWVSLDFKHILTDAFGSWNGEYTGFAAGSDDRIVFDNDDDAYMLLNLEDIGYVLMHSKDYCRSWDVIPLFDTTVSAKIEHRDAHNDLSNPPTILVRTARPGTASVLDLIVPYKDGNGRVRLSSLIPINRDHGQWVTLIGGGLNVGKGTSNLSVSFDDKVHITFAGRYTVDDDPGTPQYAVTYNRTTGAVTAPFYLGSAGIEEPDNHNWPGIVVDSQGYVHIVLGSHGGRRGQRFRYRKSLNPNDTAEWEDIVDLISGFTYLSLICDMDDNLHIVARDHWDPYVQKLKYIKKPFGEPWTTEKVPLVVPYINEDAGSTYNRFDQTIDIDRNGNLYITYWNGQRVYFDDEPAVAAFSMKWPLDSDFTEDEIAAGMKLPHPERRDAAMLVSKDNGNVWRLVRTEDFKD